MILAFMGNDGSGKTTIAKEIKKILEKNGRRVDYQPGFDHLFLDKLVNLWGQITKKDTQKMTQEYLDPRKKKKSLLFKIWPYLVFLECGCFYLIALFKRKTILLFDRYFYDYLISYEDLGYSNSLIRKLFLSLPKPDIGLVFDVSPQIAFQRKKAVDRASLNYYKQQRLRYLKLAKIKKLPVINTETTLDQTIKETLELIRIKKESQILIKSLSEQKISQNDWQNQDWPRLLQLASANRVLYPLVKNLSQEKTSQAPENISQILAEGDKKMEKLKKTLRFIKKVLAKEKIPFLIVKTKKTLPYITFDVDVLVHPQDFKKAEALLKKSGAKIEEYQPKDQSDVYVAGLERIDLHKHFYWHRSPFLDQKFLWQNYRESQIQGIKCPVPSKTVDWALTVLNLLYERYHLPLLEFFYLIENAPAIDLKKIIKQAEKHGWDKAFQGFLVILAGLEQEIGAEAKLSQKLNQLNLLPQKASLPLQFPYLFPTLFTLQIFGERVKKQHRLDLYQLAYYFFAKTRFYLTQGTRVPVYGDWFDFNQLKW